MNANILIQGHILGDPFNRPEEHEVVIRWKGDVVARMQSDANGKFAIGGIPAEIFDRSQEGYSIEVDGSSPSAVYPSAPLHFSNAVPSLDKNGAEIFVLPCAILIP